ncbi:MAG: 6-phosphogluconolactonase, partial [Deltaproteobacteria bacterium]|nr:6-phosphogluconolactonase [Deltaproteobacteria bacterium]
MTPGGIMVFKSSDEFVAGAASLIAAKIREILKNKSSCSISLAGGNTPGPVYRALADETVCGTLPLEKIELYFGDERFVLKEDKDSNYFMAKSFFGDALDRFSAVHTMDTEGFDEVESLKKYDSLLEVPIDIMILGLGEDAHVASIFPGSILFEQNDFKKAAVIEGPKPPPKRMTITPIVISN